MLGRVGGWEKNLRAGVETKQGVADRQRDRQWQRQQRQRVSRESRVSQSWAQEGRQAGGSAEVDEAVSVTLRLIDRLKRAGR